MIGWLGMLLIGIVLNVIAYLLMPRPKQPKPEAARDMEDPTAEAGQPVAVVFGTMQMRGINLVWFGQKRSHEYTVSTGGGGKK